MRALASNFQSFELFLTNDLDVLVVASNQPQLPRPDWSVFQHPDIAMDLSRFRALSPAALERTRLITRNEMLPLIAGGGGNSDYYPFLDLRAERSRYLRREAFGFSSLPQERFDLAAAIGERRIGWLDERVPALSHQRIQAQALAARIRTGESAQGFDTATLSRRLQGARLRSSRVELELRSGRPPADWVNWFAEVMQVERDRHQGTMGVVDSAFYRDIERYMNAQQAPDEAKSAWRFARAAFTYNWRDASREVAPLIVARAAGRSWIATPLFVEAGTLARLRSGDVSGARQFFDRFRGVAGRGPTDLRIQLLDAMLQEAERAVGLGPDAKDRGGRGTG
jgi:hypothetical protein